MSPRQYQSLQEIFDNDDLQLLKTNATNPAPSRSNRTIETFKEINTFIDQEGREPSSDGEFNEKKLARRLKSFRNRSTEENRELLPYDHNNLLSNFANQTQSQDKDIETAEKVTSLEDIFADDDGLLDIKSPELYEERHVSFDNPNNREMPDEVAKRESCEDFWRFESLFQEIHEEINTGESYVERFQDNAQIEVGNFFILDGILCLVDQVVQSDKSENGRYNPRLRVVFNNGTESNMLLRSLERALQKDPQGRRVLLNPERALDQLSGINHHDRRKGSIYILKSLRKDPEIKELGELYKIGYTEESVNQRVANAEKSPTYLEAPVQVVATYECYNANPRNIERLIHAILLPTRVNITLRDRKGQRYRPNEWFAVPLQTAKDVVERIADGTIQQYRLDSVTYKLVKKGRFYK